MRARVRERASERASKRAREQARERASERASERESERARERESERDRDPRGRRAPARAALAAALALDGGAAARPERRRASSRPPVRLRVGPPARALPNRHSRLSPPAGGGGGGACLLRQLLRAARAKAAPSGAPAATAGQALGAAAPWTLRAPGRNGGSATRPRPPDRTCRARGAGARLIVVCGASSADLAKPPSRSGASCTAGNGWCAASAGVVLFRRCVKWRPAT